VFFDEKEHLFIGENLRFENPREIPRAPEQLFLDRLGGVIRYGEILAEIKTKDLLPFLLKEIEKDSPAEQRILVGISGFGGLEGKFLKQLLADIKAHFTAQKRAIRIENQDGANLTSGRIFSQKLLQKGCEYLLWKKNDTVLVARTVANQNLRNYTLRDRIKPFRDAHMGMLPPKLAQILINLANPSLDQVIIDPFCGSGTVNIEAAIMGYRTVGTDIDAERVAHAEENFRAMAEKFRYPVNVGKFQTEDATKLTRPEQSAVVVTEGFLGENICRVLNPQEIQKNAQEVLSLWKRVFQHIEGSTITTFCFTLPKWGDVSLSKELSSYLEKTSYTLIPLSEKKKTLVYKRPDAHVEREICLVKKR